MFVLYHLRIKSLIKPILLNWFFLLKNKQPGLVAIKLLNKSILQWGFLGLHLDYKKEDHYWITRPNVKTDDITIWFIERPSHKPILTHCQTKILKIY